VTAERVLILYQGDDPGTEEVHQLVKLVEREGGVDLVGVRISVYPTAEPSEMLAQALVLRLEDEGEVTHGALGRMTAYTVEAAGGRRVVAAVWLDETNAWVRRTIPVHMAKVAGTEFPVVRRPGWERLTSEPALSFVASAADGDGRRFPDVHIVVSVLPEARPRRIRRLMPGGYVEWVDSVFRHAGAPLGQLDIAHWLVCVAGRRRLVHLAYWSTDDAVLLPWELLSRAEKRRGDKLA
jgi:hypothetical protein